MNLVIDLIFAGLAVLSLVVVALTWRQQSKALVALGSVLFLVSVLAVFSWRTVAARVHLGEYAALIGTWEYVPDEAIDAELQDVVEYRMTFFMTVVEWELRCAGMSPEWGVYAKVEDGRYFAGWGIPTKWLDGIPFRLDEGEDVFFLDEMEYRRVD